MWVPVRRTLDNSNALLTKHLAIRLVNHFTLTTDHVSFKRLRVHFAHATDSLLSITLPLWLADDFHFITNRCFFLPGQPFDAGKRLAPMGVKSVEYLHIGRWLRWITPIDLGQMKNTGRLLIILLPLLLRYLDLNIMIVTLRSSSLDLSALRI